MVIIVEFESGFGGLRKLKNYFAKKDSKLFANEPIKLEVMIMTSMRKSLLMIKRCRMIMETNIKMIQKFPIRRDSNRELNKLSIFFISKSVLPFGNLEKPLVRYWWQQETFCLKTDQPWKNLGFLRFPMVSLLCGLGDGLPRLGAHGLHWTRGKFNDFSK